MSPTLTHPDVIVDLPACPSDDIVLFLDRSSRSSELADALDRFGYYRTQYIDDRSNVYQLVTSSDPEGPAIIITSNGGALFLHVGRFALVLGDFGEDVWKSFDHVVTIDENEHRSGDTRQRVWLERILAVFDLATETDERQAIRAELAARVAGHKRSTAERVFDELKAQLDAAATRDDAPTIITTTTPASPSAGIAGYLRQQLDRIAELRRR